MSTTPPLTPIVALIESLDTNIASYELRRRGFIVEKISFDTKSKKNVFLLTISQKLIAKISIVKDISVLVNEKIGISQQSAILNEAVDILIRSSPGLAVHNAWVTHDKKNLSTILSTKASSTKISLLCEYFGPQIGLYFGWLDNYTLWLLLPTIIGMLTYGHQYVSNNVDSPYIPFFAIFMCMWGTLFLEFSKRKCSELSFSWHSFGVEDVEIEKDLANSVSETSSSQPVRLALSFVATVVLITLMLIIMLHFMHENIHSEEIYGASSYLKYYPLIMYSILPIVSPLVFEPVAELLNEFESHSTKIEAENYLILKQFLLQFVNRYSGLLYLIFWKRDLPKLRELLISLLTVGALINNATELCPPYINATLNYFSRKPKEPNVASVATASSSSGNSTTLTEKESCAILEAELSRVQYNINEDYLEMVIQFGYVTMFAVAFPLTPLFAYLNNTFELFVDFQKLQSCQRQKFVYRSNIGAWQTCLQAISFVSVLTNCFLLALVSDQLYVIVPFPFLHSYLKSEYGRMFAMWALEHILFAFKIVLMSIIPDVPRNIRIFQAKQAIVIHERNLQNKISISSSKQENKENENSEKVASDAAASTVAATTALALSTLQQDLSHTIGYNPIKLTSLFMAPLALHYSNISPWVYMPLSIIWLSYLQIEKDRSDRKAAMGIVTNTSVLRIVEEELPSWIRDSEFQRVEWLNTILQQMWPHISQSIDAIVRAKLLPQLNKNLPPIFSELTIKDCSLGSISPKIIGIRILQSSESNIRFDVEVRWAGDPLFSLNAGMHLFPINVSLADLRISATIRVEILDFCSTLPCFKAISVTCMKKPYVDFSLKIAKVDIMNLGAANYNLPTLLRHVIHMALTETALYPKKIIIPMNPDSSTDATLSVPLIPVGILHVKIVKGIDLLTVNLFGGSDPYVTLYSVDQHFRSTTKKLNVNPIWNEDFQILVFDKETQEVECNVYDHDVVRKDTFLGRFTILLNKLQPHQLITKSFDLIDVSNGKIVVQCKYSPVSKLPPAGGKRPGLNRQESSKLFASNGVNSGDVIYDLPMDELSSNQLLMESTLPETSTLRISNVPNLASESKSSKGSNSPMNTKSKSQQSSNRITESGPPVSPFSDQVSVASAATNHSKASFSFLPKFSSSSHEAAASQGVGVLNISGLKLRNLEITATSKVYLSVKFNGNKSYETKAVKHMKDPYFPDQFNILIFSVADDVLTIRVMMSHKITSPTMVAEKVIPVRDLVNEDGNATRNEQEYMLSGEYREAFVGFKTSWSPSE